MVSVASRLLSPRQVTALSWISIGETSLCFNMQLISCLNAASVPNLHDMSSSRVVLAQGTVGGSKYSTVQACKLIACCGSWQSGSGHSSTFRPICPRHCCESLQTYWDSVNSSAFWKPECLKSSDPKLGCDFSDAVNSNNIFVDYVFAIPQVLYFRENQTLTSLQTLHVRCSPLSHTAQHKSFWKFSFYEQKGLH